MVRPPFRSVDAFRAGVARGPAADIDGRMRARRQPRNKQCRPRGISAITRGAGEYAVNRKALFAWFKTQPDPSRGLPSWHRWVPTGCARACFLVITCAAQLCFDTSVALSALSVNGLRWFRRAGASSSSRQSRRRRIVQLAPETPSNRSRPRPPKPPQQ